MKTIKLSKFERRIQWGAEWLWARNAHGRLKRRIQSYYRMRTRRRAGKGGHGSRGWSVLATLPRHRY